MIKPTEIFNFYKLKNEIVLLDKTGNASKVDKTAFEEWLINETDELVWPTPAGSYYQGDVDDFWSPHYPKERKLKRLIEFFTYH